MAIYFFPIESSVRELDYKIIIAENLVKRGHTVIVGEFTFINRILPFTQHVVYFGKQIFTQIFPTSLLHYTELKKRGGTLVHLDEEGAVYQGQNQESYASMLLSRLDVKILRFDDVVITWGQYQSEFYKKQGTKARVLPLGHPKFDRNEDSFKEGVKSMQVQQPYVLINSNLTLANNGLGVKDTFSGHLFSARKKRMNDQTFFKHWAKASHQLTDFIELAIALISEIKGVTVVYRPHPSEDMEFYENIFASYENVIVNRSGNVTNWIKNASFVIHYGCTTALESIKFNIPTISYSRESYFLPETEYRLPKMGSTFICNSQSEVIDLVKKGLLHDLDLGTPQIREELQYFIRNIGSEENSSIQITEVLHELSTNRKSELKLLRIMYNVALYSCREILIFSRNKRNRKFSKLFRHNISSKGIRVINLFGNLLILKPNA